MPLTLTIGEVYTVVVSEDNKILAGVDRRFAVDYPDARHLPTVQSGDWDGKIHLFSRLSGKIPTGLLPELREHLRSEGIPFIEEDTRGPGIPLCTHVRVPKRKGLIRLRPEQIEAVRRALLQGRGVLDMATNSGKTVVAAALIKSWRDGLRPAPRVLYLVPTRDLLRQTADVLDAALSGKGSPFVCGRLGDSQRTEGEVTVALPNTLWKARRTVKGRQLLSSYEALIIDECHHSKAEMWYKLSLMCTSARWRIGLSGTAFRGDDYASYRLMAVTGPRLITVSNREMIDLGVSAEPIITFVEAVPDDRYDYSLASWDVAYQCGVSDNRKRNAQIVALSKRLVEKGLSVLVLTLQVKQGRVLYQTAQKYLPRVWFNHGSVPSSIRQRSLEEFRAEGGVMIATTIYDEGVDVPEIGSLILAGAGKSEVKAIQRIGRAIRKKKGENITYVYDFADWGNEYLMRHSKRRLEIYEAEGFRVTRNRVRKKMLEEVRKRPTTSLRMRLLKKFGGRGL